MRGLVKFCSSRLFFTFLSIVGVIFAQISTVHAQNEAQVWQAGSEENIAVRGTRHLHPEKYSVFKLNRAELARLLNDAPLEFSPEARERQVFLQIPTPKGEFLTFRIEESPVLSPKVARQFPSWKTFQGTAVGNTQIIGRFDWTDSGFHGYVSTPEGTFSIDPYQSNDVENYLVFAKHEFGQPTREFHCKLDELLADEQGKVESLVKNAMFFDEFTHGTQIRTYRLAVATTFEYTNFFRQMGDTDPQAQTRAFNAVTTSVNRINLAYRKELAVQFNIVSGTNLTFVVNPETPSNYNNDGSSADLNANQANVDSVIGAVNYDVGHLFETGDGGVAQLGSVCGTSKARGLSGLPNPTGDPFDIDYVAHELGHQFAANHTFSAAANCGSSPTAARREPGSAVTIMGYAGICSSTANVQRNSIDTFHVYNLTEIINFITTGNGSTCGTLSGTNAAPVISALTNYTIPFNTPFALTAGATDANSDPLTYSWEQNDPASAGASYPGTTDDDDTNLAFRPGFRSYLPTIGPTRSFPSLPYILNNSNEAPVTFTGTSATGSICAGTCITGEDLPSSARTMNFRVTVRDGVGGISDAGMTVTVVNTTTPFKVTTQNTSPTTWAGSSNQTVTWDVSGTNAGSINTANVKISLSADGGQTFPFVLSASTPNDGSESILVPNILTTTARIKVEAIGNIFFDINDANFGVKGNPTNRRFVDFDGDGKTDISIFRPAVGEWWYLRSSDGGNRAFQFGASTDKLVPGDYTGDGKTDIAFFRPSTGNWFIFRSENFTFYSFPLGTSTDIPTPGDFDGDGKTDAAVFRPSTATWFIQRSSDNGTTIQGFGVSTDLPAVGDYDGDGKDDIAIYRPSSGQWWLNRSTAGIIAVSFGSSTDKTVQGDYTGDGKTDIAFWRPSTGEWFVLRSENSTFYSFPFGASTDLPVPGDYDGDGRTDGAVYRPSSNTWFVERSTAGTLITGFGASGDIPVPNFYVR